LLNGGTGWTAGTPAAAHKYPVFLVSGNPYNATTMADDVLILIPARMASIRLPGKPAETDEVEINADEIWGLMIGPGGVLPLRVY